jgi:hypothetical protein
LVFFSSNNAECGSPSADFAPFVAFSAWNLTGIPNVERRANTLAVFAQSTGASGVQQQNIRVVPGSRYVLVVQHNPDMLQGTPRLFVADGIVSFCFQQTFF